MAKDDQGFAGMSEEERKRAAKEGGKESPTSFEEGSTRAKKAGEEGGEQ